MYNKIDIQIHYIHGRGQYVYFILYFIKFFKKRCIFSNRVRNFNFGFNSFALRRIYKIYELLKLVSALRVLMCFSKFASTILDKCFTFAYTNNVIYMSIDLQRGVPMFQ